MMMGRKFLFTFIIAFISVSVMLFALQQNSEQLKVVWGKQWGTEATELVTGIALDGQDNIYIAGVTKGNLFEQNQGKLDIFIIKLDSEGNVLWGKQLGSEEEEWCDMAVDGEGNVYLVTVTEGNWFGKNFGNFYKDIVLLKLSSSGEILWSKRIGTEEDEVYDGIAIESNHFYIAGGTTGSLFGDYKKGGWGGYEGFLAKFDLNGNLVWGKQFSEEDYFGAISVDSQSNIYVAGLTIMKDEANDKIATLLAKFNPNGTLIWKQKYVFPIITDKDEKEIINSMRLDGNGNIYASGEITVYVDENKLVSIPDAFVGKYSCDNGQRIWSKRFRSEGEKEIEEAFLDVTVDEQGYVYVVGYTEGSLFGNHLGGIDDVILAKFDGQGNMLWGKQWGSEKGETGAAIDVDGQGNIYVAGATDGDLFGKNAGKTDIFIVKFKQ